MKRKVSLLVSVLVFAMMLAACGGGGGGGSPEPEPGPGPSLPAEIQRVSVDSSGAEGDSQSYSYNGSISGDGRYVAFESGATNLVSGDTNGITDIFVHDRRTGATTRVSVASSGAEADDSSYNAAISGDGRYVAFYSDATNLVTGDNNGAEDVFVHDRQTGATTRISVNSAGAQAEGGNSRSYSISSDGRYVAFHSAATNLVNGDLNGTTDIFVHDRQTSATTRVSVDSSGAQANSHSYEPSISSDGRYVAFYSYATNLVSGDTNGQTDIFVHDRQTGATTRVSVSSSGAQADGASYEPSLSGDGRYVAFHSAATNLVTGDTNGKEDVFVHDRQTGATTRVSVDSSGAEADNDSYAPSISSDGRYVAFYSYATNLVSGDTNGDGDIFVHDRQTGATTRVSINAGGAQADGSGCYYPSVSSDGRYVAFYSDAANLVSGDTNNYIDVFVAPNPPSKLPGASGSLDISFDNDGKVTTAIGNSNDDANAVAIQTDGKIVVAGYSWNGTDDDFAVSRYNADGSLDTSFGVGGSVTTDIGGSDDYARAVAIQTDGKIVVAGISYNGTNNDIAVLRYTTTGVLDATFDTDGIVTTDIAGADDFAEAVVIQNNGKIVVAGYFYKTNYNFAVVRYNANGSLDATFNSGGIKTTPIGTGDDRAYAVAIQPSDGNIVVAGYYNNGVNDDIVVTRYTTTGALDTSFGAGGIATTAIGSGNDYANAVAIQTDGKIVVAGSSWNGAKYDIVVSRYTTTGGLDATFAGDGIVTTAIGTGNDVANAVAIQGDGRIVVAGYSNNGADYDIAVSRYTTTGGLDATFDGDGIVTTAIGIGDDRANAVAIQGDGKIVVAGYSYNGADTDFAVVRYWP